MEASLRPIRSIFDFLCSYAGQLGSASTALIILLLVAVTLSHAQTTTISGTVYDPRTTAGSLPLPNVLVYVTTDPVAPLPAGVQCLTAGTPTGVTSYTNTAVDGTFTLSDVPVNSTYTLVIQAGKWRRQFSEAVTAIPLTGLSLHMPSDHTQGDIPMIAISTGSVDALECVLRQMGVADTEFTDDNGTTNPGGRIHLYKGVYSAGANINASTPSETRLMGTPTDASILNNYDMVMFPCQGNAYPQSTTSLTNLLNYADAGGRVFTTHYSFDRLDPDSPYDAKFPPVANWKINQGNPTPDPGIATINTGFTDGATLSQWLQNAGVSYNNTPGQVQISTLRRDFTGVIAPTQSWLTLNSTATGNPVMQFTFNTPVGAAAANQCGRVLFNEYHVFNASSGGKHFPAECPAAATMSAQAQMLEYALFDLSTFVTPVVVPTLSITFTPSPMIVKQGDSADQLTVGVTNTSTAYPIYSSVVLTLSLPPGLTATALTDPTGGWICTLGTLTCTRATSIAANAGDSVLLTVSVPPYQPGSATTGLITATASSPNFSSNVVASDTVIFQQPPAITWANPAPITYGTALSGMQLNATSPVTGAFSYTPSAGTVLSIGPHTLQVTLTPTDTVNYTPSSASVTLQVLPATPVLTLIASSAAVFLSNPVTFTAALAFTATAPTGTVVFFDGATPLGSGTISAGLATLATSAMTFGVHSITAVYSGDTNYQPATSSALSETVQDFTFALSGGSGTGSVTVAIGGQATYPLVITPTGGTTLPGAINLTVTGLPPGMTAVFSPAAVAANSGTTNVTLLVKPPGLAASQLPRRPFGGSSLPVALGLILLPFACKLRKAAPSWNRLVGLALIGAALTVGMTGCLFNLTPKSSSLTITVASGSLSHSTTVKLTVQ